MGSGLLELGLREPQSSKEEGHPQDEEDVGEDGSLDKPTPKRKEISFEPLRAEFQAQLSSLRLLPSFHRGDGEVTHEHRSLHKPKLILLKSDDSYDELDSVSEGSVEETPKRLSERNGQLFSCVSEEFGERDDGDDCKERNKEQMSF